VGHVEGAASGSAGREEGPHGPGTASRKGALRSMLIRLAARFGPVGGRQTSTQRPAAVHPSAATCRVKLCPLPSVGRGPRRGRSRPGRRQGGGLHHLRGINGVGADHHATCALHAHLVSRPARDSRELRFSRRAVPVRSCRRGQGAHGPNGPPLAASWGGRSARRSAADGAQRIGAGPAWICSTSARWPSSRSVDRHLLQPGPLASTAWRFGLHDAPPLRQ